MVVAEEEEVTATQEMDMILVLGLEVPMFRTRSSNMGNVSSTMLDMGIADATRSQIHRPLPSDLDQLSTIFQLYSVCLLKTLVKWVI